MDYITLAMSKFINDKGISILSLAGKIRRSYGSLYPSLKREPTRKLKGDEFLDICNFFDIDPRVFAENSKIQFANKDKEAG